MGVCVAELRNPVPAAAADGRVRIVVNLAAGNVGHLRIEQRGQSSQDAALGLTAQSQQNKIMTRKNGIDDLRHHGIVVADDARENRPALAKFRHQVVAQFVLHAPASQLFFGEWTVAQLAERPRKTHDRKTPRKLPLADYTLDFQVIPRARCRRLCGGRARCGAWSAEWFQRTK